MAYSLRLIVVMFVAALCLTAVLPGNSHAADAPSLVDWRTVELDDTRIIGISPNGTAIAATDFDNSRLCIYESDTLEQRTCADLSPLEARLRIDDVVWSPDSNKLALSEESFKVFIDGDLWVMDAISGELTNLTDDSVNGSIPVISADESDIDELFVDVSPTWLPDSSGVTFSRSTWRNGDWAGNAIYTVPVTGGEPELETIVTLESPGVVYFGMRWTADRSALYYSVNHPNSDDPLNGIWRVNADGLDATKLVALDPELGPPVLAGLSPDGNTVLVHYAMAAAQFRFADSHFYALLDVPSGALTPLTIRQRTDSEEPPVAWPAVLSPDGRYVLYVGRVSDPVYQVYITPVDGGDETVLVPEGLEEGAVPVGLTAPITWSNTGTVLLDTSLLSSATLLTIDTGTGATPDAAATPTATVSEDVTPASEVTETELELGAIVTVNDNDVPLRSTAGTGSQTVATLTLGTELRVLGPAVDADGFTWIPVADLSTNTVGYIRSEFISRTED